MTMLAMGDFEKEGSAHCEAAGWQRSFNECSGATVLGEKGNQASVYLCKGYVPVSWEQTTRSYFEM